MFFSRLVIPFYSYRDNYASPLHSGLHYIVSLAIATTIIHYQWEAVTVITKFVPLRYLKHRLSTWALGLARRLANWLSRRPELYPLFLRVCGAINPFTISPPPFFSDKSGRLTLQKKERVKLYTQLKKSAHNSSPRIQELLTTAIVLITLFFNKV